VCWASGEKGGEGKEPKGEKESGPGCLVLFLSFFLYSIYSNKLFEFKIQFEFKPINPTQIKQCCSMNAQTF
jgi:hypothetical protein